MPGWDPRSWKRLRGRSWRERFAILDRRDLLEPNPALAWLGLCLVAVVGAFALLFALAGRREWWVPATQAVLHAGAFAVLWFGHRIPAWAMIATFVGMNALAVAVMLLFPAG
jgi:hypothetical protein